jgi:penicillin-binding protein 1A
MPVGLVAYGEGRNRALVYSENADKERPPEEEPATPPPAKAELEKPPTD